MKQMLLDLGEEYAQTLETFEAGANGELLYVLAQTAARGGGERFVYLWGEPASGKTHLLHALESSGGARYIDGARAAPSDFDFDPTVSLYLLDDCHLLGEQAQIDAFNLFNGIREYGGYLVSSGPAAPLGLDLREDLRTRLGWGLIYQVHALSDDEKIAALSAYAQTRGLPLSPGVLPYLLSHFKRDMRSLSSMLDRLDRYSLETQRPITLPLLRSLLQETSTDP